MDAGQRDWGVSLSCGTKRQGCWNRVVKLGHFPDLLFSLPERGKGINDQKFFSPQTPLVSYSVCLPRGDRSRNHGSIRCFTCGSFLFAPPPQSVSCSSFLLETMTIPLELGLWVVPWRNDGCIAYVVADFPEWSLLLLLFNVLCTYPYSLVLYKYIRRLIHLFGGIMSVSIIGPFVLYLDCRCNVLIAVAALAMTKPIHTSNSRKRESSLTLMMASFNLCCRRPQNQVEFSRYCKIRRYTVHEVQDEYSRGTYSMTNAYR